MFVEIFGESATTTSKEPTVSEELDPPRTPDPEEPVKIDEKQMKSINLEPDGDGPRNGKKAIPYA